MHIHHISLYTANMEAMVGFYRRYFGAVEHSRYHNPKTGLHTCFLQFDKGCMLEIMTRPGIEAPAGEGRLGYAHIALNAGSPDNVDFLTRRLEDDGIAIESRPRLTGDHYYESTLRDPDGNLVEITGGPASPPPRAPLP